MSIQRQRFGFVLLPGYSLLALSGALDALQAVNRVVGDCRYEAVLLGVNAAVVNADLAGTSLRVQPIDDARGVTALFVVAEHLPQDGEAHLAALDGALRPVAAANGVLGGIGSGAAWLAHLGYLHGYRCTLPWSLAADLAARRPECIVSHNVYEIDRTRLTCAGHTASLHLFIAWLGQRHGERVEQWLVAHFGLDRLRARDERQTGIAQTIPGSSTKLADAVALMQSNLSEPLSTEDIAGLVGVSRRQLERLFKQYLDTLPARWYLEQRLARARQLLQQTSQSILQIGLSCGFSSGAHFSNAYRGYFGHTPREERSARTAAWRQPAAARPAKPPSEESA